SAGPMLALVDFSFDPEGAPDAAFAFSNPAYGLFYSRQGFAMRLMRGTADARGGDTFVLVDGMLQAWGSFRPFKGGAHEGVDLFLPVGLHGDYRQLRQDGSGDGGTVFDVTVVAVQGGLGLTVPVGSSDLALRSAPFFGLASRSFGTETGTSAGYSVDIELAAPEWRGRYGIYAGWGFRWQRWLLQAAAALVQPESSRVEYHSQVHAFQVGLTF
ncbi:MAG: hypothetical protein O3C45_10195, partial [Bacteroidetes bacterium]|nr:hypothetical protein [Bacteroidota bacterium]